MVEKVIRALKSFGLRTHFGKHNLTKGEEKRIRFRNQRGFEALLRMGNFIEVGSSADIPVILSEVTEDTIVGVEPVDKLEKEPQSTIVAVPEVTEDTIVGVDPIEIPVEDTALDEAGESEGKEKETPEDLRRSEPAIEEIPIEEQDKSKHTRLSDVIDRP